MIKRLILFIFVMISSLPFAIPFTLYDTPPLMATSEADMEFGDIDGDGDLDFVMIALDGSTKLYTNDVSGNFNNKQTLNSGNSHLVLGDIDNDQDLDLIVNGYNGSSHITSIFKNDGTGAMAEYSAGMLSPSLGDIVMNDFNNDGALDIILTDQFSWETKLFLNDGSGNFIEESSGQITGADMYEAISVGDLDNDDDLDIVFGNKIYMNDGLGNFTHIASLSGWDSSALGDLDGDGDLDIVIVGDSMGEVSKIYINDGAGSFNETNIGLLEPLAGGAQYCSVALGDLDNDGDLDIVISGSGASYDPEHFTGVYLNDGVGNFSYYDTSDIFQADDASIAFGDIDGDGDLDFIISGVNPSPTSATKIYRNDEINTNNEPEIPGHVYCESIGGKWSLFWNPSLDDHSPQNMMRYQIAVSTGTSGDYNYQSSAIQYPRGQANIGNVKRSDECLFQTSIPFGTQMYWKLGSMDTCFKFSGYSSELASSSVIQNTPTSLVVQSNTATSIELIWSDNSSNEDGFILQRKEIDSPRWITVLSVSENTEGAVDGNLDSGSTYFYRVRSFIGNTASGVSNEIRDETLNAYSISGVIMDGMDPVVEVRVDLSGDSSSYTLTDDLGEYSFDGLSEGGTYVVTALKTDYIFVPVAHTYSNFADNIVNTNFIGTKNYSENLENILVYPNPVDKNQMENVIFANLTENCNIKVYAISGELVFEKELNQIEYSWNMKNNDGEEIKSGVYIYVIENDKGERKTGKIAVVR
ncbi:VCBS repeat-containing protein [bacterium]|nr:VCBS repeat-containing protein [bacterium]